MKINKENYPGLSKWPAMVVVGKNITKEQAKEIIIRTSGLYFSSNDHEFDRQLEEYVFEVDLSSGKDKYELFRNDVGEIDWQAYHQHTDKAYEKYKIITDLDYLQNSRIVSCWIGGPHGWCDWNGRIFSDNYNIGKYPSVEEVEKEWRLIAEAFPFLELKCQLFNGETCEEDNKPIIQFNVANGIVEVVEPEEILVSPNDNLAETMKGFLNPGRERGCTFEQFKDACDYINQKYNGVSIKECPIEPPLNLSYYK
jgi:hypothetical protein